MTGLCSAPCRIILPTWRACDLESILLGYGMGMEACEREMKWVPGPSERVSAEWNEEGGSAFSVLSTSDTSVDKAYG